MEFGRPHVRHEGVTTRSNIRVLPVPQTSDDTTSVLSLDAAVVRAANQAALDLFGCTRSTCSLADSSLYPERLLDNTGTRSSSHSSSTTTAENNNNSNNNLIQPDALVVISESFDNLKFVYATPKAYFSNRNGHFCHDDFIHKKPFGCQVRSRNHQGYGHVHLLKPTPELWARSLTHRTQIVHELDASMILFRLQLRPNMVVCESGTGSGAMSHAILRSIAPHGMLHTYEFHQSRVEQARREFVQHKVDHLVTVHNCDVCGKHSNTHATSNTDTTDTGGRTNKTNHNSGGFGLGGQAAHAVFLDLPEPWWAVPHAAHVLKRNGKLASYSPCVEQSQRVTEAMRQCGFHSIQTLEVRLREYYVDEVSLEMPPCKKRRGETSAAKEEMCNGGDGDAAKTTMTTGNVGDEEPSEAQDDDDHAPLESFSGDDTRKRKTVLCARPFANMRGHTAFLTFATAGNKPHSDPNDKERVKECRA